MFSTTLPAESTAVECDGAEAQISYQRLNRLVLPPDATLGPFIMNSSHGFDNLFSNYSEVPEEYLQGSTVRREDRLCRSVSLKVDVPPGAPSSAGQAAPQIDLSDTSGGFDLRQCEL